MKDTGIEGSTDASCYNCFAALDYYIPKYRCLGRLLRKDIDSEAKYVLFDVNEYRKKAMLKKVKYELFLFCIVIHLLFRNMKAGKPLTDLEMAQEVSICLFSTPPGNKDPIRLRRVLLCNEIPDSANSSKRLVLFLDEGQYEYCTDDFLSTYEYDDQEFLCKIESKLVCF